MISILIYHSYNILINHNELFLYYFSSQVALVKATQKDHTPLGQVHTKIVMDLDTNPTVSHLDNSSNYKCKHNPISNRSSQRHCQL